MENTPALPQNRKATTDSEARSAKPEAKEYKLSFGGGLYLLVKPNGLKYWRMKYRFNGVEKSPFALGVYPQVSLKEARKQQANAKELLAQNIDPNEAKKTEKRLAILQSDNTFEAIAHEWLSKRANITAATIKSYERYLSYAFEAIGHKPIISITPPDVLAICRKLEAKGTVETAHRVKTTCGLVFKYAVGTGRVSSDPTRDLKGVLQAVVVEHQAAITNPADVARLLQDIQGYEGHYTTVYTLKLAPLVFVRPSELRQAKWADIDLDAKEWTYKVSKTQTDHIVVPL